MKQKIKYQYTYFIHPFVVKENKYSKYLLKMLKDEKINLKTFQKDKDLELYQYFLPKMNQFLFSSFDFSIEKLKKFEKLPIDTKSNILSKYPCTIFEYQLEKDVQGKTDEKCIFFKIQKLEIICFNTGICFLIMKTNVEDANEFSDILNFNYRFRDIQKDGKADYSNIHLQTDIFEDITKLTDFIKDITGSKIETRKLDLDTQRFLSYSYICIDQQMWGVNKEFENIENNFIKFANFLSADNSVNFDKDEKAVTFLKWKYAKLSVSKQGVALFTSDADMYNYTILPNKFEKVYFYTYIINLYKKIYLKKLDLEFRKKKNINKTIKKFIDFTKQIWTQEITEDEVGSWINNQLFDRLEIQNLYFEVKNKYDVLYKNMEIEKKSKIMILFIIVAVCTIICNVIGFLKML